MHHSSMTNEILSDDNWDVCNIKEPDACTQVREVAVKQYS